jgi:hypothetical protein
MAEMMNIPHYTQEEAKAAWDWLKDLGFTEPKAATAVMDWTSCRRGAHLLHQLLKELLANQELAGVNQRNPELLKEIADYAAEREAIT